MSSVFLLLHATLAEEGPEELMQAESVFSRMHATAELRANCSAVYEQHSC